MSACRSLISLHSTASQAVAAHTSAGLNRRRGISAPPFMNSQFRVKRPSATCTSSRIVRVQANAQQEGTARHPSNQNRAMSGLGVLAVVAIYILLLALAVALSRASAGRL